MAREQINLTEQVAGLLPVANGGTNASSVTTAPAASAWAGWDANLNLSANTFLQGTASTVTSASTLVLTIASAQVQVFTGITAGQIVKLPTTSVPAGQQYTIINQSTQSVTVEASNATALFFLGALQAVVVTASVATPTDFTQWTGLSITLGKVLSTFNSLYLIGTDGTVMTFPSTSATIARTDAAQTFTGVQTFSTPLAIASGGTNASTAATGLVNLVAGGLVLPAGTTSLAPLKLTSGTNLTTPTAGVQEYDGTAFYLTPAASTRCVNDIEQFCTLTTAYTLALSQTAAQKMFNTSTNGAVTLPIGSYFFECMFTLSSLNTGTSSVFGWALAAGTAVITAQFWESLGGSTVLVTPTINAQSTMNRAANTAIVAANTTGIGWAKITGKVRIGTAGTVIPSISLSTAATPIVGVDSYFRVWSVGSATVTTVGNWS
jgi:hypothetical protein